MPTTKVELYYRAASFADASGDGEARLDMFTVFKGKTFKVATLTLADLARLTGTSSQAYKDIESQLQRPALSGRDYLMIQDLTIDNITFVNWAKLFPNSPLTAFLRQLNPKP